MMPLAERPEGVVWVGGVCVVPDETGIESWSAITPGEKDCKASTSRASPCSTTSKAIFEPVKSVAA